ARGGAGVEALAAVVAAEERNAQDEDALLVGGIDANLAEIEGPRAQVVQLLPAFAAVVRAENAAGFQIARSPARALAGHGAKVRLVRLIDGVQDLGIFRPHIDADAPSFGFRQPFGQSSPVLAAVGRLVQ